MNFFKSLFLGAVLTTSSLSHAETNSSQYEAEVTVDYEKFAGTWYEIASKPSWGQRNCVATESIYTLADDGKIALENRCRKNTFDGKWKNLEAMVWPKEGSERNGELTLQVWWPFKSELWILDIDEEYQTAIIGTPNLSTVWLLSKTQGMSDERYQLAMKQIVAMGFDVNRLQRTPQPLL